jgi:hypothetical protein
MAFFLDAMPAPWAAHKYEPNPKPTHLASADPADRRVFCPAADRQLTHAYTAFSTAALLPLGQPAQPVEAQDLLADLRSVLVIFFSPFWAWHTCLSIIANRKRLSNCDRQTKHIRGDCRVYSTSFDKGSCFAMA